MANIVHDGANDPELIKKALRVMFTFGGPNGADEDKLREHYRAQGYDMSLVNRLITEVASEPGMKIKKVIK